MVLMEELRRRARSVLWPVACALLMTYYGYHLIEGERGLKTWWRLNQDIEKAKVAHDSVAEKRKQLAVRVSLLRKQTLNADMVDERARRMLNILRPDEYVIFYDRPLQRPSTPTQNAYR